MVLHPVLGLAAIAFVVLGLVASLVATGVLVQVVVSSRRERLARHQSLRTYYGRLSLSH